LCAWLLVGTLTGCATTPPYVGQGPHSQISRGRPVVLIDGLGNVLGLPAKILLWSWKIDNHAISEQAEGVLIQYLAAAPPHPALQDAKFRLNEYSPFDELSRLRRNRHVAWPYRLLLGVPTTLVFEVLLPGRLIGGDHYNPFTNTVHVYSDEPAVLLHEAGHAHDFAEQRYKGAYAMVRLLPGIDLFQEFVASEKAIQHFVVKKDRPGELRAYTLLYPAYGTYLGSYLLPFGNFAGALVGHIWGRAKAHTRAKYYRLVDTTPSSTALPSPGTPR